jgi:hypothetical protein
MPTRMIALTAMLVLVSCHDAAAPELRAGAAGADARTTRLNFTSQPQTTIDGATIPPVRVSVSGAPRARIILLIEPSSNQTGATLGGTVSRRAVNGIATFTDLHIDVPQAGYRLRARSPDIGFTTSAPFDITAAPPPQEEPAVQLAFTVQPSAVVAGSSISPAVRVAIQDAAGNTKTLASDNVTLAISGGTGSAGAALGGTVTRAAVSGVAIFDNLSIDRAGSGYTLTASAGALTAATSNPFPVTATVAGSCASPLPAWIFCDDFDADRLASYFEVTTDGGSMARVSGVGRNGSYGIRSRFTTGQVSAGSLKLAFGRTPAAYMRPVDAGTRNYREIYWRVYLRNAPGWTGGGGDKLTRLTVFANSSWAQAMIAHVWSGSASSNRDYLLLDPASGTDAAGSLRTTGYNDFANLRWLGSARSVTPVFGTSSVGQWYCIEAHVKLNTAGQSDGAFDLKINGQLEVNRTGLNWVGNYSAYGLNALFLESYWNSGSPANQERYFDDFVVSEQPIGC